MKHFTLSEFTYSQTALVYHIDNTPSEEQIKNLECLCNLILDPLREAIGHPIYITSGFRTPRLNQLVGGSKTSAHKDGLAADFRVGNIEYLNDWAWCLLKSTAHPFRRYIDQCVYYRDKGFIHIGLARNEKPRGLFWIA